jgi:hypothetical protein
MSRWERAASEETGPESVELPLASRMLRVTSVMMRRRKELIGWSGTVLLVGLAVACSINPQPLPPDAPPGYDAGVVSAPGTGGSDNEGSDAAASVGTSADAGVPGDEPDGAAAALDAGVPETDGGDAGDGGEGDASDDASDGNGNASDAG